jgi:hypothetical protein
VLLRHPVDHDQEMDMESRVHPIWSGTLLARTAYVDIGWIRALLLAIVLVGLAHADVMAEWVPVVESSNAVMYVDPLATDRRGDVVSVRELQNPKRRNPDGEISRQGLVET